MSVPHISISYFKPLILGLWLDFCFTNFLDSSKFPENLTDSYPSQERAISPAARTTLHQGGSNFACGANYRTRH
jgi:hypothetical protein